LQRGPQRVSLVQNNQNIRIDADYGKMPLYFIPNQGQMDKQVAYYVQGKDKTIYFTPGGITFALMKPAQKKEAPSRPTPVRSILDLREERSKAQDAGLKSADAEPGHGVEDGSERWAVKLDFVGADKSVKPVAQDKTGAVVSYFKGKPEEWRAGLPTYSKVVYPNLWPGIDLVYYGTVNKLKYEFIVHPGVDPSIIWLTYRGVESVSVNGEGRLKVTTPVGGFTDDLPVAYQVIGGRRSDIKLAYKMDRQTKLDGASDSSETEAFSYGFDVGNYDPSLLLVLDPAVLVYCGYIGGSSDEYGRGIAVDGSGNAYVTGETCSTQVTFPVTVGPDLTQNGSWDALVAKVNAAGTALVYCGYIGGSADDGGYGIAVDGAGNAYVTGETSSGEATFPVTVGPDLTQNGSWDAFVAKVNAAGTALVYCGYIGGSSDDFGTGIALDASGNAYVTGETTSNEATFPETVGPDLIYNAGYGDAFVAKVNAVGTALVYCGYIGGSSGEVGWGIAADGWGNAYVTGVTESTEATFPVTVGPDLTQNGSWDAFVAKVNAAGTALVYCGFIGGSSDDEGYGISLDGAGNAYVTGDAESTEATFPVTVGPDLTHNGGYADAFVAKVNASGTALVYCGYIGGSSDEYGYGIAVDGAGNAYVTGYTGSTQATFPAAAGPDLSYNGGTWDAFVAKISYRDVWVAKHAVGDFDGDGTDEVAVDFGAAGVWMYNSGAWTQLTASDAESLITANVDGNNRDEIVADMGAAGLWLWKAGAWNQLSGVNVESMAAGDVDADGADEIVGDFGNFGLWLWNGGAWTILSGVNADYVTVANVDGGGGDEIFGDFGATGLWVWNAGAWTILSGVNADFVMTGRQSGARFIAGDFGPMGLWMWSMPGLCTQLSGINADYMIAANTDGDTEDEIVGDFGATGLWHCEGGLWTGSGFTWTILSGANADFMIRADVDGNGTDEIVVDFGTLGLWLWNGGVWTQLSGVNPEYILAADVDGDNKDEILADFGSLGLWQWNEGAWSQISAKNPD
jgi:hypothetical protein